MVGGINNFARWLEGFRMPPSYLVYLREQGVYSEEFIERMREERAILNVFSASEGEVVGPGTPVLELHGRLFSLLMTYPRAFTFFRTESSELTQSFIQNVRPDLTADLNWDVQLSSAVPFNGSSLSKLGLAEGKGSAHVHRLLDNDGMMQCDQVDYKRGPKPLDARSLLIRYVDNSAVCRPLPDKTRSAAYHQQSIGEIGTPEELVEGSRKIEVQVRSWA